MPDSKPNEKRLALLKEFLEDLLKPGYVNQRIEDLKKKAAKLKKDSKARALFPIKKTSRILLQETTPFLYRFLDVSSASPSEEQVVSDFNFPIIASYCSSFAGDLPTKKEAAIFWAGGHFRLNDSLTKQDWAEEEAAVLRTFASWACNRKGSSHEKLAALKQIIQARKKDMKAAGIPGTPEEDAEDTEDAAGTCNAEEGGEEEAREEDDCLPGDGVQSDAEKDGTKGTFQDEKNQKIPAPKLPKSVKEKAKKMLNAQAKTRKALRQKKQAGDEGEGEEAKDTPKDEEGDDEEGQEREEPEEEEQADEQEEEQPPERVPEQKPKTAKQAKDNERLAQVKDRWRPRFEALNKKDPRMELDHGVLSSDNQRFNPYSGCFYIMDATQERLDKVNRKFGQDFQVNRKDGASLGWNKFDSLGKAPGAWHLQPLLS
ncbi:unnamed protein product [Symbiodinium sp. CCMP2592]|nr:unnamed protein product [Symbiodinium sp. CCMP2592]